MTKIGGVTGGRNFGRSAKSFFLEKIQELSSTLPKFRRFMCHTGWERDFAHPGYSNGMNFFIFFLNEKTKLYGTLLLVLEKKKRTETKKTPPKELHDETLHVCTVFNTLSDSVIDNVHLFFSNRVVTTGKVVCCIFFTIDKKFRMKKIFHGSSPDIFKNSWFKIDTQVSWHLKGGSQFLYTFFPFWKKTEKNSIKIISMSFYLFLTLIR